MIQDILKKTSRLHFGIIFLIIAICITGFVLLYGAAGGSVNPYVIKQVPRFIVGIILMWGIAIVDLKIWYRYAYVFYIVAIALLIAVYFNGHVGMGARRWIDLKFFALQPSELAKVCLVLALAKFYHSRSIVAIHSLKNIAIPFALIGAMFALVVVQPDLGTSLVLYFVGVAIMIASGLSKKLFVWMGIIGLSALPIMWLFLHGYQKKRLLVFLNPENDPLGAGYHIMQSKIAIGSSDFWGKGFMQGTQSHLEFLPEKHTDFIFTLLTEDFGMLGALLLLLAYALVILFGILISLKAQSLYAKHIALGMTVLLFVHVTINISMVMGLMPVVGIPLPFVSYGGTSMMTMLISMGFLLNVHVHRDVNLTGGSGLYAGRF
ncbi:MAG: rod shape determining protein RodA [bacterium]|jgi:rod shape determining protein RodA